MSRPCQAILPKLALAALVAVLPLHHPRAQTTPGQTTPAQGTLQLPPRGAKPAQPAANPAPPKPAPREKVHQEGTAAARKPAPHAAAKRQPEQKSGSHPAAAHSPAHAKPLPAHPPAPAPSQTAAPAAPPAGPAAPDRAPEAPKGSVTGLPLPRFASLRSDEVNLRIGPGTRYPIEWVYKRRDLPVEIEREFDVWRLVIDPEGTKGWVHQATLTGRRSFVVTGAERTLHRGASDDAAAVAKLMPGVIGRIRSCDPGSGWCQVQVGDYRGWLKRDEFWGSFAGEAIQ